MLPIVLDEREYEVWTALKRQLGMAVFSMGQPAASAYFQPYRDLYPHTFPVTQDWVNACFAGRYGGRLISFADYWAFFGPQLPAGEHAISHYLGTVAHSAVRAEVDHVPNKLTYRDLLSRIWGDRRINQCPARLPCFAWAARWEGDGWVQYVDGDGLPLLQFSPDGYDDYYTQVG